jgi:tetrahydromethanopterin S-methyltransferase subunit H
MPATAIADECGIVPTLVGVAVVALPRGGTPVRRASAALVDYSDFINQSGSHGSVATIFQSFVATVALAL